MSSLPVTLPPCSITQHEEFTETKTKKQIVFWYYYCWCCVYLYALTLKTMKNLFKLLIAVILLASCTKQEPCIDTGWFDRQPLGNNMHMEWAGEISILADSIAVEVTREGKVVYFDTMYNEEAIIPLGKQETFTIKKFSLNSVQSEEFFVQQRYEDCSNRD